MSSFYARKSGKSGWRLTQEVWSGGKRKQVAVPDQLYSQFGFRPEMTLEEARARVKLLNAEKTLVRHKHTAAARRVNLLTIEQSVYLPQPMAETFQTWLIDNTQGSGEHLTRILSHWKYVQEIVIALSVLPVDFHLNKGRIFNYFKSKKHSLDYFRKVVRILNAWGHFYCEKHGHFFRPLPKLSRNESQILNDTNTESDKYVGPSGMLTPKLLESIRYRLLDENYKWLFISVWFGLRPKEISLMLTKKTSFRIERDIEKGVDILVVYQSKLTSIEQSRRWKFIPVICPEQKQALHFIKEGTFKVPRTKLLRQLTDGKVALYGGRKAFTDLMLDKGQSLEDISSWLGHQSIEMTWKRYRNKKRVSFTPIVSSGKKQKIPAAAS
jgi:hypothetical protein